MENSSRLFLEKFTGKEKKTGGVLELKRRASLERRLLAGLREF